MRDSPFAPNAPTPLPPGQGLAIVAVDIGNSQIKVGQFELAMDERLTRGATRRLPEPLATITLPIAHESGEFDTEALADWCQHHLSATARWRIGSVHRAAAANLIAWIDRRNLQHELGWHAKVLSHEDLPMAIRVEEPARVGMDRLLAGFAAGAIKAPDRAAIVIDLGTATTVDIVEPEGAFAGGAILPGIGMASRALAEQTDALPRVAFTPGDAPPPPVGGSTRAAIEAGLYWGAVGAVRELVSQIAAPWAATPDLFITGGAAQAIARSLALPQVECVPHLVLAGIALLDM